MADRKSEPILSSTRESGKTSFPTVTGSAAALDRYHVLDEPPTEALERIAFIAARRFGVPLVLVTFVEPHVQWVKACFGYDVREIDPSESFCMDTITSGDVVVIPDLAADARYADNPFVTGDFHIRFYAGAPLRTPDGVVVGTVCILDTEPNVDFDRDDREDLAEIAHMVISELELHATSAKLRRSERQHGGLLENALNSVFALSQDGRLEFVNPAFEAFTSLPREQLLGRHFQDFVVPEDRSQARQLFEAALRDARVEGHIRVQTADRGVAHVDLILAKGTGKDGDAVLGSARDVSQQIRAEVHAKELTEELAKLAADLKSLTDMGRLISWTHDLSKILDIFLQNALERLDADAAHVYLYDDVFHVLRMAAMQGDGPPGLSHVEVPVADAVAGSAALERKPMYVPNLADVRGRNAVTRAYAAHGLTSMYVMPLVARGALLGTFTMFFRDGFEPTPTWTRHASNLATQAAIAIDNTTLVEHLQRSNTNLALAYDATIEGWARTLDLKDQETEGHSRRVTELTVQLAQRLGIHGEQLAHIRRGAILHDIGKMGIPDHILKKPGKLTPQEWDLMKQHPRYAHEVLSPIPFLQPALDIPRHHHEKYDGTGYPDGLQGENIPLPARIFTIIDVWDALTNDRPYRKAWTPQQTKQHLQQHAGTHFDPHILHTFLTMLQEQGHLDHDTGVETDRGDA